MAFGRVNPQFRLEDQGIEGLGNVYYNLMEPALIEAALKAGEGHLGNGGTFLVSTGKFTGRSPKDKHVVKTDSVVDSIWWENNAAMTPEGFDALHADMLAHMKGGEYFVQDLFAGADPEHRLNVRVVTELAWHGLFIRHMLRRPDREELENFAPDFTIINCPSFRADPKKHGCRSETVIALNFDRKLILIGGTIGISIYSVANTAATTDNLATLPDGIAAILAVAIIAMMVLGHRNVRAELSSVGSTERAPALATS